MSSKKQAEDVETLPRIYFHLLEKSRQIGLTGQITHEQYDIFIDRWKETLEFRCIVANCDPSGSSRLSGSGHRLMMPLAGEASEAETAPRDPYLDLMGRSIAMSVAELLWMLITIDGILPVLEIATPAAVVKNALAEPGVQLVWASLYLPTCAAYFFEDIGADGPNLENAVLVGWADELFAAEYRPLSDSDDEPRIDRNAELYLKVDRKAVVPSLIHFPYYFSAHNAEIVVGYFRKSDGWEASTINGLTIAPNSYSRLFATDTAFGEAVRKTIEIFRPSFLEKTADAANIHDTPSYEGHRAARMIHSEAIHNTAAQMAISVTHSLAINEPHDENKFSHCASSFLTALITIPNSQLEKVKALAGGDVSAFQSAEEGSQKNNSMQNHLLKRMEKTTLRIWDNIDILKLPISRAMVKDAISKEKNANAKQVASLLKYEIAAKQLDDIRGPLEKAIENIRTLQGFVRNIDSTLNTGPLAVAMRHAQIVSPLFESHKDGTRIGDHFVPLTDHNTFTNISGEGVMPSRQGLLWLQGLWLALAGSAEMLDKFFCENILLPTSRRDIESMTTDQGAQVFSRAKLTLANPAKGRGALHKLHWLNLAVATGKSITVVAKNGIIKNYQVADNIDENSLLFNGVSPFRNLSPLLAFIEAMCKARGVTDIVVNQDGDGLGLSILLTCNLIPDTSFEDSFLAALNFALTTSRDLTVSTGDQWRAYTILAADLVTEWRGMNVSVVEELSIGLDRLRSSECQCAVEVNDRLYNLVVSRVRNKDGCSLTSGLMIECRGGTMFTGNLARFALGTGSTRKTIAVQIKYGKSS